MASPAQVLRGGVANQGRVLRVGDTVHRPATPNLVTVHPLLRHLEAGGFAGAPRLLSTDGRTEVLSWIPGRAAAEPLPSWCAQDEAAASVARLVRHFHDAVRDYGPPVAQPALPVPVPADFRAAAVSHNDLHPGNIVFRDGQAVGLIDFDLAGSGGPIWDLATLVRGWAPLVDDADLPPALMARPSRRFDRLALMLDAYGLAAADRQAVVDALVANHDWTYRIVTDAVRQGHPGFGRYWAAAAARTARARRWLLEQYPGLRAAVT